MAWFAGNRFVRLFPALLAMVTVVSVVLLARGFPVSASRNARCLP